MPRFFKKGFGARASGKPKAKAYPRRRLQPVGALLAGAAVVGKRVYKRRQAVRKQVNSTGLRNAALRREQSDNITTAKAVVVGKQRKISFQEKVSRTIAPPLLFKRNYQFSSECVSGRKGFFSMELNVMNTNDLAIDITNYKSQMRTDTATADGSLSLNAVSDGARFYVDSLNEKINMINSSSNSLTGKIHLFAHKRDNDNNYQATGTPITPINLMMYYSTGVIPALVAGVGNESTIGNGWNFNTAAGVTNYQGVYNMPGSSINAAGNTASTDTQLHPFSHHIKDRVGFWFRKVSSSAFSLKPGQQFNSSFVFNDLPKIFREQVDYVHVAGTSFSLVVEFEGQIVGDSTALTDTISTGTAQLSVIRQSVRILGLENTLKSKIVLQTAPPTTIGNATQIIINPDAGISDTGVELDA